MKLRNPLLLVVSLLLLLVGTALAERQRIPQRPLPTKPVRHETAFKAVPGTPLQIRAIEYDGAVNGRLTVQVKNTQKSALKFSAQGLYFIPEGDPDTAPQRLGAVGPMQLATDKEAVERTEVEVPAGGMVELHLDVFCIDSHRSSPSTENTFAVGNTRMPKELSTTIEQRATSAVKEAADEGDAAPRAAAKAKVQSEVWRSRDAKWIKLDGEGKQEAGKK